MQCFSKTDNIFSNKYDLFWKRTLSLRYVPAFILFLLTRVEKCWVNPILKKENVKIEKDILGILVVPRLLVKKHLADRHLVDKLTIKRDFSTTEQLTLAELSTKDLVGQMSVGQMVFGWKTQSHYNTIRKKNASLLFSNLIW